MNVQLETGQTGGALPKKLVLSFKESERIVLLTRHNEVAIVMSSNKGLSGFQP